MNTKDYKELIKDWDMQKLRRELANIANVGGTTKMIEAIEEKIRQIEGKRGVRPEFGKRKPINK